MYGQREMLDWTAAAVPAMLMLDTVQHNTTSDFELPLAVPAPPAHNTTALQEQSVFAVHGRQIPECLCVPCRAGAER